MSSPRSPLCQIDGLKVTEIRVVVGYKSLQDPSSKTRSMKMLLNLVVLAALAFCLSAAKLTEHVADKDFLIKQKNAYDLLWHVGQPLTVRPELAEAGKAWDIEANIVSYSNKPAVEEFLQRYRHGMLPRGQIFGLFYRDHREEAIALFKLFYYAKDYDTFYKTALWARVHVNEGQFVYAFTVATVYRPDTKYIILPAPWELYPFLFFNTEVIERAQMLKMQGSFGSKDVSGVATAVIPANYSGWYIKRDFDPQEKLKYFTEDIGLNAYCYVGGLDFPFWMPGEEYGFPNGFRGQQYFNVHQHLLARYYLERLSNGLGKIEEFDWNKPFPVGYYPSMAFHNGLPVPQREQGSEVPSYKYKYLQEIQDVESRIRSAIDSGFILAEDGKLVDIYSPGGFDILGNIIHGNADSYNPKFYKSVVYLAKTILGFNPEPATKYQVVPSVLQDFRASVRDPAFFVLYKRVLSFFFRYKKNLPPPSYDELAFPGVKIESVEVDDLVTYFEPYDALINSAVRVNSTEDASSFLIKARSYRLNHKPYSFHFTVSSDKNTKACIRLFLGAKYDEYHNELDISENYMNFFQLDQFNVDLIAGVNKIDRRGLDAWFTGPDPVSSEITYRKLQEAIAGKGNFTYKEEVYGFPERLQLPKGREEGMPFQLFVHISDHDEATAVKMDHPVWGKEVFDAKRLGFPLDRPMYGFNFTLPNMRFVEVVIFHKSEREINVTV